MVSVEDHAGADDCEQRRLAMQIAIQLPDDMQAAMAVLGYAAVLVEGFSTRGLGPPRVAELQRRASGSLTRLRVVKR